MIRREKLARDREDGHIFHRVSLQIKQVYGYCPDYRLSPKRNARNYVLSCPLSLLRCHPSNLAFHNLCDDMIIPNTLRALLGLGLNFNIRPIGSTLASVDLDRFLKDFDRRCMFSAAPPDSDTVKFGQDVTTLIVASVYYLLVFREDEISLTSRTCSPTKRQP